jgi:lambda family phage portal protein
MAQTRAEIELIAKTKAARREAVRRFARRLPAKMASRSSYDGAVTNRHNKNHWISIPSGDSDSANLSELSTLRSRCRHEQRNNPYAMGIARKAAHYIVSTGPTAQVLLEDEALNTRIESAWAEWCDSCDWNGDLSFDEMLHLGVRDLFPSGEYFKLMQVDPRAKSKVRLRLQLIEADRVCSPWQFVGMPQYRDGIEVDQWGKKVRYWVAKWHPGSSYWAQPPVASQDFLQLAPENVIHFYVADRPEQSRGMPLLAQTLEIFAKTREWDEATLAAAQRAALFGVIMVTNSDLMIGDNPSIVDPEEWELEAGMGIIAPPGYDAKQISPEHPSQGYSEFKKSKLQDAGAAVDMPYNVLASDSSGHNYASGRLDWQGLTRSIKVLRSWIEKRDLHRVFRAWWTEAQKAYPEFSLSRGVPADIPVEFRWPGFEHVDPMKEANAAKTRMDSRLQTYADYYAEQGKDWRAAFAQIAVEQKEMQALGITPAMVGATAPTEEVDEDDEEDMPAGTEKD